MSRLNAFPSPSTLPIDAPLKALLSIFFLYISLIPHFSVVFPGELHCHGRSVHFHCRVLLPQVTTRSEMARAVGSLAFVTLALACLVATATAREVCHLALGYGLHGLHCFVSCIIELGLMSSFYHACSCTC